MACDTNEEAAGLLMRMKDTFPAVVADYVLKNKADILLSHLTKHAREVLGRVLVNGQTAPAGHSQGCESAHAMLDRILATKKHDICNLIDAVLSLFKHQFNNHVGCRMGRLPKHKLKQEYQHLSLAKLAGPYSAADA